MLGHDYIQMKNTLTGFFNDKYQDEYHSRPRQDYPKTYLPNGYIHILNNAGEYISNIFIGSMSMLGGINILKKQLPSLGDSNNDSIINVVDIIQVINFILDNETLSPYSSFASDFNNDSIINIIDITGIVSLITYE